MKKFLFLTIFFFSCLEKPKIPDWDTEITIPLLEKKFTIFSFLDSSYLTFNTDSSLNFFYQDEFETLYPISKINFNSYQFNKSYYFNQFEIKDTFSTEIIINIEEILGIPFPDSLLILPPTNIERELSKTVNINALHYAFLEKFFLILNLENHSLLNFSSFKIEYNKLNISFDNLSPNSQEERVVSDADLFIASPFNLLLTFKILTEDSVLLRKSDFIKLVLKFIDCRVAYGELKLKKTVFNWEENYPLSLSSIFDLNYGEIKEGYAELNLFNNFPFPLTLTFKIKEINYEDSFLLSPFYNQKKTIPLAGKIIFQNSSDKKGVFVYSLEIKAQPADTENFFNIQKENYFSFSGEMKELKFRKIKGKFSSPLFLINKKDSIISEFLGNPKGIKLERVELILGLVYNFSLPIKIFLAGKSINRNQEACSLFKEISLPPVNGQPLNYITQKIDITSLINNGPRILQFHYSIKIEGEGEIGEDDFMTAKMTIDAPLKFTFEKDTFIAYEKKIVIGEEEKKKINEKLVGGELVISATNHFPIGFEGSLILKPKAGNNDSLILPFTLLSGEVSEKGYCERERKSEIVLAMAEPEMKIFQNEELNVYLKINLPEREIVILKPSDFLSFQSYATLKVKTKEILKTARK
jgi:hypothetical protein